jgi:hypothetical protein
MFAEVESTIRFLRENGVAEINRSYYSPKWTSPWWHMMLLFEMGRAEEIPKEPVLKLVEFLRETPLKIFPINDADFPEGNLESEYLCHCQVGNVYQLLYACGVNVDSEVQWLRPYMLKYQMADGGLNCDSSAYKVEGECPSSMVAVISIFEALVKCTPREFTEEELIYLDRAAAFLMDRQLIHGSTSAFNAEERDAAPLWMLLSFPRYYFYDILRGLHVLLLWAEKLDRVVPIDCIKDACQHLQRRFPDSVVTIERRAFDGRMTWDSSPSGEIYKRVASTFPLLDRVSIVGAQSTVLTEQYQDVNRLLKKMGLL